MEKNYRITTRICAAIFLLCSFIGIQVLKSTPFGFPLTLFGFVVLLIVPNVVRFLEAKKDGKKVSWTKMDTIAYGAGALLFVFTIVKGI